MAIKVCYYYYIDCSLGDDNRTTGWNIVRNQLTLELLQLVEWARKPYLSRD